jgi:putative PIN family toxin of toxin-antitoxin system
MKVLIDTNILISAALNPEGTPCKAFFKAVTYPNKGIMCDQNIEELRRIFNRKFPQKISLLEHFLSIALLAMEVIPTPSEELEEENNIRDVADRPILRAALAAKVDVILTGDKDFLESGITNPKIMTAGEFITVTEQGN